MPIVNSMAPQLLVNNLKDSIGFYENQLGFTTDFIYEDFYASVSVDGHPIHLKCAPKLEEERRHRKSNGHLDVFINVTDAQALYQKYHDAGAVITQAPQTHPWGTLDFQVEDPDGYILCFSQDIE